MPVNVTLLFDEAHYRAAADAYMKGIERRVAHNQDPFVGSVASVFISRWDSSVSESVPAELKNDLGLAIGLDVYRAYRELKASDRWLRLENAGAKMQRLLWASTGTKDPNAPDTLYVLGLAAPFTINTMPDKTLEAFYDHGDAGDPMPPDGGNCDALFERFEAAGVDLTSLAAKLQSDGARSFVDAWTDLMQAIAHKSASVHGRHSSSTTTRSAGRTSATCSPAMRAAVSG